MYTAVRFINYETFDQRSTQEITRASSTSAKGTGIKVEITVRDEVVAELRAAMPEPEPGAAVKKLVQLMRRLPKHRGRKTNVSEHINEHLYGSSETSR